LLCFSLPLIIYQFDPSSVLGSIFSRI
jgi:hypothetical protein